MDLAACSKASAEASLPPSRNVLRNASAISESGIRPRGAVWARRKNDTVLSPKRRETLPGKPAMTEGNFALLPHEMQHAI